MLRLLWSENATRDVRGILNFISDDSPNAARKLRARIEEAILPVLHFPYLHREGRVPGTREIVVHPNYIVVYAVRAEHIEIVTGYPHSPGISLIAPIPVPADRVLDA